METASNVFDDTQQPEPQNEPDDSTAGITTLNTPEVRRAIREDFEQIARIDAESKALGMQKSAIFKKFKHRGIDLDSARAAFNVWKMESEKREEFAIGFDLCAQAAEFRAEFLEIFGANVEPVEPLPPAVE